VSLNIPITSQLLQNYPNPFNPVTTISYSIDKSQKVRITIYNTRGRVIETLVNEFKPAGEHSVDFDGANLPSGLYIAKLQTGSTIKTNKMLLMK
jgi:flagellar hook assembly protein FlgD